MASAPPKRVVGTIQSYNFRTESGFVEEAKTRKRYYFSRKDANQSVARYEFRKGLEVRFSIDEGDKGRPIATRLALTQEQSRRLFNPLVLAMDDQAKGRVYVELIKVLSPFKFSRALLDLIQEYTGSESPADVVAADNPGECATQ